MFGGIVFVYMEERLTHNESGKSEEIPVSRRNTFHAECSFEFDEMKVIANNPILQLS